MAGAGIERPSGDAITSRVAAVARQHPSRVALAGPDGFVTYAQLDRRIGQVARRVAALGLGRGSLVVVHLPRSCDVVVAMTGVMRSGAAYSVVEQDDGDDAEQRRRITAATPDLVVTTGPRAAALRAAGLAAIDMTAIGDDEARPPLGTPRDDDVAYVIFTSGSTGVPKGVAVTHANLRHYVEAIRERLAIEAPLRYAHVSTLAADLGHTCLLLSLWTGGTLYVVGEDVRRDPAALVRFLVEHRIQFLKITPSHWTAAFHAAGVAYERISLDYLVLGGEALPVALAREILSAGVTRALVNHYGPTETTVGVTANVVRDERALPAGGVASVPIGTPLGRTRAVVRSDDGAFHTRSAIGELYIGGPSVAKGYVDDPATTAAGFVTGVDGPDRFYRTGDIVRVDADGVIEFRCRTDRQVKIGGHRVELAHVESVMRTLDRVSDAAAFHAEVGDARMLAAAVVASPWPGESELRARLERVLPRHMIPQRVLSFDRFPLNGNGKTDLPALGREVEERLADQHAETAGREQRFDDELVAELHDTWSTYLKHGGFGPGDDFFAAGGTSIDAIQVISDLQARGHPVTANAFLRAPTIDALAAHIRSEPGRDRTPAGAATATAARTRLSAAQQAFLDGEPSDPDHYNQALVLEVGADAGALAAAVADVVELHPLLRTAFRREAGTWRAEATTADGVFSRSTLHCSADEAVATAVAGTSERLHRTISVGSGRLFRAHLTEVAGGADQLLLICHHLAADAVSWRILLADLARCYAERVAGRAPALPQPPSFWCWTDDIAARGDALRRSASLWRGMLRGELPALRADRAGPNRERDAASVWMAVQPGDLAQLTERLRNRLDVPLHVALLGAFGHAVAADSDTPRVLVDVESHGRTSFADGVDVSRTVGWFTSTFPLAVSVAPGDGIATMRRFHAALSAVPDLGVGYGVLRDELARERGGQVVPGVSYNFLGEFAFPAGGPLKLATSRHRPAPARGPFNDRGAELKLTARTLGGTLVLDLSFSVARHDTARIAGLLGNALQLLFASVGLPAPQPQRPLVERGSASGLLTYAPARLESLRSGESTGSAYRRVLLTGATGFVGAHVLRELLHRTEAHVVCLVRAADAGTAADRLRDAFSWYFPDEPLDGHDGRWTAVPGDVARERFRLDPQAWEDLARGVEAIYHFAADTRLFADGPALERANLDSTRTVITLAVAGRQKDVHQMSTLAVSGINPAPVAVRFSEASLDVGQRLQNEYERTKYAAEQLVREHAAEGGRVFVYRSGNVGAHSRTGRFQRNGGENRLVQLLRAVAKVGRLPARIDGTIVLSPVDVVAAGIVALSVSPDLEGGTFHVESGASVRVGALVDALRRAGVTFDRADEEDFAGVLQRWGAPGDRDVALGRFWAGRPPRNVRYESSATLRRLETLGVAFPDPDDAWLDRFVAHLIVEGALPSAAAREPHGPVAV